MQIRRTAVHGSGSEPAPTLPETLMVVAQVAAYLQLSCYTVRKWARQGTLPCVRIGTQLRFERHAIEDYLRARGGGL